MQLVRENAKAYSHRLTADNLQKDVVRWIKYRYRKLDAQHRKNLSFVIATIEPNREKRSKWYRDGKEIPKPKWFPYVPEWSTLVLKPSRPGELTEEKRPFVKIIGVTGENRAAVKQIVEEHYGFAFEQPELQMQTIMSFLKLELMRRQIKTVGGLFQSALLSEQGIQWLGYAGENVVLEPVQGRFVQRNVITGETLPLMTIWEWAKLRPPPGTFGAFEDPDLRKAVENLRRIENETNGPVS